MLSYHKHVKTLCRDNDIQWRFSFINSALLAQRQIRLSFPIIITQTQYATALHEIGHLLGNRKFVGIFELLLMLTPSPNTLYNEKEAWRWAEDNALVWTPKMERHKRYCLGTYGISDI